MPSDLLFFSLDISNMILTPLLSYYSCILLWFQNFCLFLKDASQFLQFSAENFNPLLPSLQHINIVSLMSGDSWRHASITCCFCWLFFMLSCFLLSYCIYCMTNTEFEIILKPSRMLYSFREKFTSTWYLNVLVIWGNLNPVVELAIFWPTQIIQS